MPLFNNREADDFEAELRKQGIEFTTATRQPLKDEAVEKPSVMRRRRKQSLIEPSFDPPCTFTIPLSTVSEVNQRQWQARSRRSNAAWKAVSKAFGPRLVQVGLVAGLFHQAGKHVLCTLTRLAPRELDRTVNLPSALKAVEDVVAFILGIDDRDERWVCRCEQEKADGYGVRIKLEAV